MEQTSHKIAKTRKTDSFSAAEKCESVLAIWTDRKKAGEICRERGVSWMVLSQWQKQAMEGMYQALTPKKSRFPQENGLAPRLARLLSNRQKLADKKMERQFRTRRTKASEATSASEKK